MSPEEKNPNSFKEVVKKKKTIMIIAGEASGDMHGANLVREMLKMNPELSFYGIGGKRLQEEGVELLADASSMAVVGMTEVISKLGTILKTMSEMKKSLDERKPDLVILIDYPDFNLPLAKAAKQRGIKVFYYISPQVWAWRKSRIKQIKKNVSKMAVILPFEVEFYREEGFEVNYVGHPLLDMIKNDFPKQASRKKVGLTENQTTIALLPGSRVSEIRQLLPEMLSAAEILRQNITDVQFVLPLAETLEEKTVTEFIAKSNIHIKVIRGNTYEVISAADLALVASGTATLETALLGVPMVIVYKISFISYWIGRVFVSVKNIGLVNIIAGQTIVPELLQGDANGKRIAAEALSMLKSEEKMNATIKKLSDIRAKLGEPGAAIRTAQLAINML
jgi:lipid-A-disaccharide synthase